MSTKLNFQNLLKELIVVFLGVLIAMLLNSWNEKRKEKIKPTSNIVQLHVSHPNDQFENGWSRGGVMTYYIALTKTDKIKAAIVGGAVSNSFEFIKDRPSNGNKSLCRIGSQL